MQKILRKRVLRDLKHNFVRYLALGILIALGMYVVISVAGAAETVMVRVDENAENNHLEDGQFSVFTPLTDDEKKEITDKGITIEPMFYLEYSCDDESSVRIFKNRQDVDLIQLDEGQLAHKDNEIVLEKRYCQEHEINLNSYVKIGKKTYKVTGTGSTPDYDAPFKSMSDSSVNSKEFGTGFVNNATYNSLLKAGDSEKAEEYVYSYILNGKMTDDEFKDHLKTLKVTIPGQGETDNLTQFTKAEDNPRIKASSDDQSINKSAGLLIGIIMLILFTYVISVFVIHGIDRESSVIGALYALGVRKKELIMHYISLPVIITFIFGIIGTVTGYSKAGINVQIQDCYDYYSVPDFSTYYSAFLIVYGVIMPPVIAAIVNYFVIRKRLSRTALSLIKNEHKTKSVKNIKLGNMGFIGRFRIRQMIRESRTGLTICFGMFISLFILMLGLNCYVQCDYISTQTPADTKYEYMYMYKYPDKNVPDGGQAGYAKTFKKEVKGYNLDVTLMGLDDDDKYFDVKTPKDKDKVIISSAMSEKYGIKKNDTFTLKDDFENKDYTFTVDDIAQYSTGFYVFTNIDNMREMFDKSDDYYNVVFADHKLDVDAKSLYSTISRNDIEKGASVFKDSMMPMVRMVIVVSILIFCVVMYLMMKVMIDRSSFNISLMKIFGFRKKEIGKLYLNGNFYVVAVGAAICIPLAKAGMDVIYPYLVSNVACGIHTTYTWQMYAVLYVGILLLYLVINKLLVGHINKLQPAQVLKNRE